MKTLPRLNRARLLILAAFGLLHEGPVAGSASTSERLESASCTAIVKTSLTMIIWTFMVVFKFAGRGGERTPQSQIYLMPLLDSQIVSALVLCFAENVH